MQIYEIKGLLIVKQLIRRHIDNNYPRHCIIGSCNWPTLIKSTVNSIEFKCASFWHWFATWTPWLVKGSHSQTFFTVSISSNCQQRRPFEGWRNWNDNRYLGYILQWWSTAYLVTVTRIQDFFFFFSKKSLLKLDKVLIYFFASKYISSCCKTSGKLIRYLNWNDKIIEQRRWRIYSIIKYLFWLARISVK